MDLDKHLPSILAWGGAALTGMFTLLGVWLASRSSLKQLTVKLQHESDREDREALRKRLEELYSLVGLWANELGTHYLPYLRVMDGDLTYNQALDITLKNRPSIDANRMFTLAELYFPSAHGALGTLMSCRDQAAAIHSSFRDMHKGTGATSREHAEKLRATLQEFSEAVNGYRVELAEHARHV